MNALFEKPSHTIAEFITTVCRITDDADAKQFAADYVEWLSKRKKPGHLPEEIMRANIGFCFGEGMPSEQILMWRKVCNASHPWFGTIVPTGEQALAMGKALGKALGKADR